MAQEERSIASFHKTLLVQFEFAQVIVSVLM